MLPRLSSSVTSRSSGPPRICVAALPICAKSGEGKQPANAGLRTHSAVVAEPGSVAVWRAGVGRLGLPEVLLHAKPEVSPRHHRFRTVHESLRHALALLPVHARGDIPAVAGRGHGGIGRRARGRSGTRSARFPMPRRVTRGCSCRCPVPSLVACHRFHDGDCRQASPNRTPASDLSPEPIARIPFRQGTIFVPAYLAVSMQPVAFQRQGDAEMEKVRVDPRRFPGGSSREDVFRRGERSGTTVRHGARVLQ